MSFVLLRIESFTGVIKITTVWDLVIASKLVQYIDPRPLSIGPFYITHVYQLP